MESCRNHYKLLYCHFSSLFCRPSIAYSLVIQSFSHLQKSLLADTNLQARSGRRPIFCLIVLSVILYFFIIYFKTPRDLRKLMYLQMTVGRRTKQLENYPNDVKHKLAQNSFEENKLPGSKCALKCLVHFPIKPCINITMVSYSCFSFLYNLYNKSLYKKISTTIFN